MEKNIYSIMVLICDFFSVKNSTYIRKKTDKVYSPDT